MSLSSTPGTGLLPFNPAGAQHTAGLVPDPGVTVHTPPYFLADSGPFLPLPMATPNLLTNSGFWFDQRGRNNLYMNELNIGLDRWKLMSEGAGANVAQYKDGGVNPAYMMTVQTNSATAQRIGSCQILEYDDSRFLRGQTVRLQFRSRSAASQNVRYAILEWTGTADSVPDVVNNWSSTTYTSGAFFAANIVVTAIGSVATTGAVGASTGIEGVVSSACNNLVAFFWSEGTVANGNWFQVGEPGLYVGSGARNWNPLDQARELVRCQRYYTKSYPQGVAPGAITATGCIQYIAGGGNGEWAPTVCYPVEMRAIPTKVFYSTATGNAGYRRNLSASADDAMGGVNAAGTKSHSGGANHTTNNVYAYQYAAEAEI